MQYPKSTLVRAERAVRCSPFLVTLFVAMRWQRVELMAIADEAGVRSQYTRTPLPELVAENELLWLMQVGLLRREVDGQGLTDSFRLTPLGRQLVSKWEAQGGAIATATWLEHLQNALSRWLRRPGWWV